MSTHHPARHFCTLLFLLPIPASAQPTLATEACGQPSPPPFCRAVRGDRASGFTAQSRSEVMARQGIVATSQPLAAQAGLAVLQKGGNAIDAAVAAAAVLAVVEPMSTGVGGDLFAIIYVAKEHKLYALNASGQAPSGATVDHYSSLGYRADAQNWGPGSGMPPRGVLTVTVPGSVWGWEEVLTRFGSKTLKDVLTPAVDYAEAGFAVSERIAHDWKLPDALPLQGCCTKPDPDSVKTWYLAGKPPLPGQVFKNPDLARTLRLLQKQGRSAFYQGEIARALFEKSTALGGTMTLADLASYKGQWSTPATVRYHGYDIYELPPPAQAWAALEILNLLETCLPKWAPSQTLASLGPTSPLYWHLLVEAKKLAYRDLLTYNADPDFASVPLAKLLSPAHAAALCSQVDPTRAASTGPASSASSSGDTVVISVGDKWGNMVSWVNSNFNAFGSGITVPGYGFVLHNRGALFSLDPKSPNVILPHKRPFNTLSAGFVMHKGAPLMTLTLMGGEMQAQGHAQALVNILDLGANVQAASDMARFLHSQIKNELNLESSLFALVGSALAALGHNVSAIAGGPVGGFQSILFTPDSDPKSAATSGIHGVYRAGSDHRKDGQAVGF